VEFVVTSNGELPTPRNSAPLDGRDGRGSCVWFNQASLFQTSELGFETGAAAKEARADAMSNAESLIDGGLFLQIKLSHCLCGCHNLYSVHLHVDSAGPQCCRMH
jgi:hypothetical protein